MKLEVGMYVRINGRGSSSVKYQNCFMIDKIHHIDNGKSKYKYLIKEDKDGYCLPVSEEMIVKASHNIIDLIEVGDYVNGGRVVEHAYQPGRLFVECVYVGGKGQTTIENYSWELTSKYVEDEPDAIKSIVTKEQFECMSYKVGE